MRVRPYFLDDAGAALPGLEVDAETLDQVHLAVYRMLTLEWMAGRIFVLALDVTSLAVFTDKARFDAWTIPPHQYARLMGEVQKEELARLRLLDSRPH